MNDTPWLPAALVALLAVLVLVVGALALVVLRRLRTTDAELARTRAAAADLEARVAALTTTPPSAAEATPATSEYVITDLGSTTEPEAAAPARIDGRLFADIVAREAVVKAASLTHGVRRALAPEVRHRIRAEMKREVKRARKQRRAEDKAAARAARRASAVAGAGSGPGGSLSDADRRAGEAA